MTSQPSAAYQVVSDRWSALELVTPKKSSICMPIRSGRNCTDARVFSMAIEERLINDIRLAVFITRLGKREIGFEIREGAMLLGVVATLLGMSEMLKLLTLMKMTLIQANIDKSFWIFTELPSTEEPTSEAVNLIRLEVEKRFIDILVRAKNISRGLIIDGIQDLAEMREIGDLVGIRTMSQLLNERISHLSTLNSFV
jgi:hypothetical protein